MQIQMSHMKKIMDKRGTDEDDDVDDDRARRRENNLDQDQLHQHEFPQREEDMTPVEKIMYAKLRTWVGGEIERKMINMTIGAV